jgi:hypothetical protein
MGCQCNINNCFGKTKENELNLVNEKPSVEKIEEPAPPAENLNNEINININTESKKKLKSKKKSNINDSTLDRDPTIPKEKATNIFKFNENIKLNEYKQRILELINTIRDRPELYVDIIKENTENIEASGKHSDKIIFKKKVKVSLYKGYEAFSEAMESLKNTKSMEPLILKDEINIELPDNNDEFKDPNFIKQKADDLIKDGKKIDFYFRDLIKYPDVAVLLMIVDDNEKSNGNKRKILLNPNVKYIGIDYKFIGKNFIAHYSFQKA